MQKEKKEAMDSPFSLEANNDFWENPSQAKVNKIHEDSMCPR